MILAQPWVSSLILKHDYIPPFSTCFLQGIAEILCHPNNPPAYPSYNLDWYVPCRHTLLLTLEGLTSTYIILHIWLHTQNGWGHISVCMCNYSLIWSRVLVKPLTRYWWASRENKKTSLTVHQEDGVVSSHGTPKHASTGSWHNDPNVGSSPAGVDDLSAKRIDNMSFPTEWMAYINCSLCRHTLWRNYIINLGKQVVKGKKI
jgi:hypothetical protein